MATAIPLLPASNRRRYAWAGFFVAVVLMAGLGLAWSQRGLPTASPTAVAEPAPPPEVAQGESDPAVVKAIAEARAAVCQAPSSAGAWGKLGMVFYVHGFHNEASVCFAEAERLDADEARWPYFQGIVLAATDPPAAIHKYEQAVERCGNDPPAARLRLAELLLSEARADEADQQFQQILKRNSINARALLGLARLAAQRGRLQEGLQHLRISALDRHGWKPSHLLAAEIYERLGQPAEAEEHRRAADGRPEARWPDPFQEEASRFRTGLKTFLQRANALISENRLPEAIVLLRQATRDYPDSDWVWLMLGKALLRQRDLPAAEEALHQAIARAPESVEALFRLGVARTLQSDYDGAAKWFRKAVELKPDFATAYYNLGFCASKKKDRAGAIKELRTALRCQYDLVKAHVLLGDMLAEDGQPLTALVHWQKAVQFSPNDAALKADVSQKLHRVLLQLGL